MSQQTTHIKEEEDFDDYHEGRKSSISSSNFNPNFYDPFEIKHRRRTSRGQFKILEKAFINNPKPSAKTRKDLAESLSMTPRGVQVWFQNRRAKAKQQQDSKKSHDNMIDDLQVSSPIVLSSSGMIHSRSQSSSSCSTLYSINHAVTSVPPPLSSPSSAPIYQQQQQQQQQQGWLSDGASTVTEEMIASSSPLLLTPPQQKQQDEYCWWMDDVSGIMNGHQALFNQQENNSPTFHSNSNVATEDHPLVDAWAYIDSLEINNNSNNENQFMHTYSRHVTDWISSTKVACNNNNFYVMLEQQKRQQRQPLIEQEEQIMRRLSEPSEMYQTLFLIAMETKDTDFRRTWNKAEYAAKGKARESRDRQAEQNDERRKLGLPPLKPRKEYKEDDTSKEALKAREERINIEQNVGKIQVVQAADSRKQPGFYCKDCDVTIKDSVTYIDHLNGRKHLNNVGISNKVEKADLSSVKERLALLKRKKENPQQEEYNLDERLASIKQQEEEERQKRREKKKQKKEHHKKKEDIGEDEDDMAKLMGFSGFGSSKA
ncbi:hypothetical protein MFLAVUS_011253 [Mucor flavus]|uniref:Homeobox domain-containing protein n=1 Tax=Mucor flavus TaxID=439312 RepID=A0ABP9ZF03_9FUNG